MLLLSLYYDNMNTELGKKKHIFVEKCRFYVSQNNGTLSEIVRSLMLAPKHVFVFLKTTNKYAKTSIAIQQNVYNIKYKAKGRQHLKIVFSRVFSLISIVLRNTNTCFGASINDLTISDKVPLFCDT
jgi:hypothetical protein